MCYIYILLYYSHMFFWVFNPKNLNICYNKAALFV